MFLTFRLHGSLPAARPFTREPLPSGKAFSTMDRLLDKGETGPLYLRTPAIAQLVVDGIRGTHGLLHAWVVMPNHVHLLITPQMDVSGLMQNLKGSTARQANTLLNRTGQAFWQEESYDRLVRDAEEFRRIGSYILLNPVRAGLASSPKLYPWCSAFPVGQDSSCGGL